ncbi:MAG TPA: hypothetical protein VFV27_05985 [Nevskiaceae bacterium]|nr:hypothetical protein [Nevskiaceae bacterium]
MLPSLTDPAARKISPPVLPVSALPPQALEALFSPYGLQPAWVADDQPIPGSYWGEPEAGLVGHQLWLRADTPVHSALHEGSHWLLMPPERRAQLHTDACGSDTEENAVCLLQCVLADRLAGYSRARCFADMDAWGYHFLLGSAAAWFAGDSADARAWLRTQRPALWARLPPEAQ